MSGLFSSVSDFFFGGGGGGSQFPSRFSVATPAFSLTSEGGATSLSRLQTPELARRTQRTGRIFGDIDQLRAEVRPGFGRFTESAVKTINAARSRRIGDLRAQLARRRVSGASFAEGEVTSAELAFGELEEKVRAQSLLQEIATTSAFLTQEADLLQREVQNELAELGVATGFAQTMVQAISAQTAIDKQLAAQEIAGTGQFLGTLASLGLEQFQPGGLFTSTPSIESTLDRLVTARLGGTA